MLSYYGRRVNNRKVILALCSIDRRELVKTTKNITFIAIVVVIRKWSKSVKEPSKYNGLSKMNAKCRAFMEAAIDSSTTEVHVEYSLSHIGRDSRLGHLRISNELRANIATKLAKRIPNKEILDEIRDSLAGTLSRDQLTTRQAIQNIKHQFNLNLVQKHPEDAKIINCRVKDLQDKELDCILCYKLQGVEKYGLPDSDFLLGVQTEFQRDSLVKHGNKLVCIDSTHSTTGYDFLLVTVMVKDELCEGIPVAWLISIREDICCLESFSLLSKNA